jgi:hypothetical protein
MLVRYDRNGFCLRKIMDHTHYKRSGEDVMLFAEDLHRPGTSGRWRDRSMRKRIDSGGAAERLDARH